MEQQYILTNPYTVLEKIKVCLITSYMYIMML